jgi:hypothetical protein
MDEIADVYKENDWLIIKKYIVRYSRSELRRFFSTRHPKTKKHAINDFEKKLIDIYKQKYKIKLVLDESQKHVEN